MVTVTYKVRLYEKYLDWILETKKLYNQVLKVYYELLLKDLTLFHLSNHNLLRELENK